MSKFVFALPDYYIKPTEIMWLLARTVIFITRVCVLFASLLRSVLVLNKISFTSLSNIRHWANECETAKSDIIFFFFRYRASTLDMWECVCMRISEWTHEIALNCQFGFNARNDRREYEKKSHGMKTAAKAEREEKNTSPRIIKWRLGSWIKQEWTLDMRAHTRNICFNWISRPYSGTLNFKWTWEWGDLRVWGFTVAYPTICG